MPAGRYDITCKLLSVVFCGPRFFFVRFRTKKGFQNCWCLKKVLQLWHKLSIGILQLVVNVVQSSNAVEKGIHQDQTNKFPLFSFSQDASFSSTWTMFASFISKVFSCYYIVSSRTDSWIINFIIWLVKYMPTNPKGQLSKKLISSPAMAVLFHMNDQLQREHSLHHSLLCSHPVQFKCPS